ncbi:MAG: hypothetical protein RSA50_05615 [Mucinivorans sp.]
MLTPQQTIQKHIDKLQEQYQRAVDESPNDIKILLGIERCIELRMRLWGFDGKPSAQSFTPTAPTSEAIELASLSQATLKELLQTIENNHQHRPSANRE